MVIDNVTTIGFLYLTNKFFIEYKDNIHLPISQIFSRNLFSEYKTFIEWGVNIWGNKKPLFVGGVGPTILSSEGYDIIDMYRVFQTHYILEIFSLNIFYIVDELPCHLYQKLL